MISLRSLARAGLAVTAMALAAGAAHAGQTQKTSSAVWWSAAGNHVDMVLRYDPRANVTLNVQQAFVLDAGGFGVSQALQTCGTPVKTGDSITSHQLAPGQYCWIRAYRSSQQDEVVGETVLNDATGNNNSINQFVRGSLEVRDANENVLSHVELY